MAVKNYLKVFSDGHTEATKHKPLFQLEDRTYAGYNPDVLVNGQWCPTSGGDELVTNGDFSDGTTTGWSVPSGFNNINVVNGEVELTTLPSGYAVCTYAINIAKKGTYKLSTSLDDKSKYTIGFGEASGDSIYGSINGSETGYFSLDVGIAYLTLTYYYGSAVAGVTSYVDNVSVFEAEIVPEAPYSTQFTYASQDDKLATFLVEDGQPVDITFDDDSPSIVQNVIQAKDMVVVDKLKINNTEWLNDGVDYDDPDAIGANPVAKIYPDGTIVGSTDNGDYVKYPNGVLECLDLTVVSNGVYSTFGSGYRQNTTSPAVYPMEFTEIDSASLPLVNNSRVWATAPSVGLTSISPVFLSFENTLGVVTLSKISVIGRWK